MVIKSRACVSHSGKTQIFWIAALSALIFSGSATAQSANDSSEKPTAAQTEEWFNEKLNKSTQLRYTLRSDHTVYATRTTVDMTGRRASLSNGRLLLEFGEFKLVEHPSILNPRENHRQYNVTVERIVDCPVTVIRGFEESYVHSGKPISISLTSGSAAACRCLRTDKQQREADKTFLGCTDGASILIPVRSNVEEKIVERLNSALTHYKTFYPQKKEAF